MINQNKTYFNNPSTAIQSIAAGLVCPVLTLLNNLLFILVLRVVVGVRSVAVQ